MPPTLLVTGGAGFIGSCHVLQSRAAGLRVVNVDKLTYSGNMENLASLRDDDGHVFVRGDIGNAELMAHVLAVHRPHAIVNFAAESHVDRSILDPEAFVRTNVLGTCVLLHAALDYYRTLPPNSPDADSQDGAPTKAHFRFLHVSTDEVFGSLRPEDPAFTETTPYAPNSPYAASKAASDHMVRAFHETYGLPVLITNCSNNYGPRQFPEKLIPLVICRALERRPLPVYGKGDNVRDWLHVEDHCEAISLVLRQGRVGASYNIGGRAERTNLDVVRGICAALDKLRPHADGPYAELITFVTDRPGHDFRYAMNCTLLEEELGWTPRHSFEQGLENTVRWYLEHQEWVRHVQSGDYMNWIQTNYAGR